MSFRFWPLIRPPPKSNREEMDSHRIFWLSSFPSFLRGLFSTLLRAALILPGNHQRAVLKPLRENALRLPRSCRREFRQQAPDFHRALRLIEDEEVRLVEVGDRNSRRPRTEEQINLLLPVNFRQPGQPGSVVAERH